MSHMHCRFLFVHIQRWKRENREAQAESGVRKTARCAISWCDGGCGKLSAAREGSRAKEVEGPAKGSAEGRTGREVGSVGRMNWEELGGMVAVVLEGKGRWKIVNVAACS